MFPIYRQRITDTLTIGECHATAHRVLPGCARWTIPWVRLHATLPASGWPPRSRPGSRAWTRTRPGPAQRPAGGPRLAGRAADARLRDDPGAGEPHRWDLAAEPRLDLPDAAAARGRGSDHGRADRGPQAVRADRGRPGRGGRGRGERALAGIRGRDRLPGPGLP